jgi:Mce-associated membrane protein
VTVKETSAVETDLTEETTHAEPTEHADDDAARPGMLRSFTARLRQLSAAKAVAILLALMVVASLSSLGALFYFSYLPDRATDAATAKAAVSAASEGTVAVLSYSPDTLDRDFSSAKSHLTGDFLSYYDQFTQQIVAMAAKQKSVKTTAVVLRAALSEFHPDSAVVLLFVNQSSQSKDRPEPALTSSSVQVTLARVGGNWLISTFNPL